MVQKIFEIEIEGKTVGFRFNMLAIGKACKLESCDVTELFSRITGEVESDEQGNVVKVVRQPDIEAVLNFFFAAAVNYTEGNKQKVDFTAQDVSDWLDFLGLETAMRMIRENLTTTKSKNMEAPVNLGQ